MKRYQIYLNPQSVAVLDEFGEYSSIPRSKIIREAVDRLAEQIISVVAEKRSKKHKKYILDSLMGFIDLGKDKKTNYAQKVDEIYLRD